MRPFIFAALLLSVTSVLPAQTPPLITSLTPNQIATPVTSSQVAFVAFGSNLVGNAFQGNPFCTTGSGAQTVTVSIPYTVGNTPKFAAGTVTFATSNEVDFTINGADLNTVAQIESLAQVQLIYTFRDPQTGGCDTSRPASSPLQFGISPTCTYSLSAGAASVGPSGTTDNLQVIAPAGCPWSVGSQSGAFSINVSPQSGSGTQTLTYVVASSSSSGSATVTIAGLPFTVTQIGGAIGSSCLYSLSPANASPGAPPSASLANTGGQISLNVNTFPGCIWSIASDSSWLTPQSASGTGPASVTYNVAQNPPPSLGRTGTITLNAQTPVNQSNATTALARPGAHISDTTAAEAPRASIPAGPVVAPSVASFTVVQAGNTACTFALPQSTQSFTAAGGTLTAKMDAPAGCNWSSSSNVTWLTAGTPSSGSGVGTVNYTVASSSLSGPRTGTITFVGQPGSITLTYTVTQSGTSSAVSCIAKSSQPPQLALEGRTEALADMLLTCSGVTSPVTVDISLTLNAPISNSCPVLLRDFGAPLCIFSVTPTTDAALSVNGTNVPNPGGQLFGSSTLQWRGVVLTPAAGGTATVRITGVRADASQLLTASGGSQAVKAASVTGTVSVTSGALVPVINPIQTMGNAAASLLFKPTSEFFAFGGTVIPLQFQELAQTATTFQSGTRLRLVLNNLPAGVTACAALHPTEGSTAVLYNADSCGNGGSPAGGSSICGGSFQQVTPAGGTCAPNTPTATWVVQGSSAQFQTWTFDLLLMNASASQVNTIAGSLGASLAPVSGQISAGGLVIGAQYRDLTVKQTFSKSRVTAFAAKADATTPDGNVPFVITANNDTQGQSTNVTVKGNVTSDIGATITSCLFLGSPCTSAGGQTFEQDNIALAGNSPNNSQSGTVMVHLDAPVPDGSLVLCTYQFDPAHPDADGKETQVCLTPISTLVTVHTSPKEGLLVEIDPGSGQFTPTPFHESLDQGSKHTLVPMDGQPVAGGGTYLFQSWEDGSTAESRVIIVPSGPAGTVVPYTATFVVAYHLTTLASPAGSGTVSPALTQQLYPTGTVVPLTAAANSSFCFVNWTDQNGAVLGTATTLNYTVSAESTVTAHFTTGSNCPSGLAALTQPTQGTVLTTSTVTFQWTSGPATATAYWLDVGNSQGHGDISAGQLPLGTLSKTVSGIATDGRIIWVRLWTQISGNFGSNYADYSFATSNGTVGTLAALTSPAPGAVLTTSTFNFQWTSGPSNATAYWLDVGNSQGHGDISAGQLSLGTLSKTVSGIPTDGRTIWVRLWTQLSGSFGSNYTDYSFATGSAGSGLAALTTPTPGSTLTGSTVTFSWSPGANATAYWLDVGTALGQGDISAGQLTSATLSKTVGGLPTDGRTIFVRLWTQVNGSFGANHIDYMFTAF